MSYVVFVTSRGLHLPVSWKSLYETDRVQCGRSDGSCGFCGVCYCLVIVWELSYGISCTKRIVFFLSLWWVISQRWRTTSIWPGKSLRKRGHYVLRHLTIAIHCQRTWALQATRSDVKGAPDVSVRRMSRMCRSSPRAGRPTWNIPWATAGDREDQQVCVWYEEFHKTIRRQFKTCRKPT